jgi:hypothetical protein
MSTQLQGNRLESREEIVIARIREVLRDLAFGEVTITVHQGQVVQVVRTERFRIEDPAPRR